MSSQLNQSASDLLEKKYLKIIPTLSHSQRGYVLICQFLHDRHDEDEVKFMSKKWHEF